MTLLAEKTYTSQDLLDNPNLAGFELVNGHLKARAVSEQSGAVAVEISSLLHNEAKKTRDATVENDEITGEAALPSFRCKVGEFFDI
jgi:hypothetical protein